MAKTSTKSDVRTSVHVKQPVSDGNTSHVANGINAIFAYPVLSALGAILLSALRVNPIQIVVTFTSKVASAYANRNNVQMRVTIDPRLIEIRNKPNIDRRPIAIHASECVVLSDGHDPVRIRLSEYKRKRETIRVFNKANNLMYSIPGYVISGIAEDIDTESFISMCACPDDKGWRKFSADSDQSASVKAYVAMSLATGIDKRASRYMDTSDL